MIPTYLSDVQESANSRGFSCVDMLGKQLTWINLFESGTGYYCGHLLLSSESVKEMRII